MPKKFKGENSKAVEARARKSAVQHEAAERKQKEIEDAYWADDDKYVLKKQQRKDEKNKKRQEQLDRKKQLTQMYEDEAQATKGASSTTPSAKVTKHQIEQYQQAMAVSAAHERKKDQSLMVVDQEEPLEENVNRLQIEGEARSVSDAISVLSSEPTEAVDRHPEKRMKQAYAEFEERRLPILKQENTNLRLSQVKQMLRKEWLKSPENPLNAALLKKMAS